MSSQDSNIGYTQGSLNKLIMRCQPTTLDPSYKTVETRKTILSFEHRKKRLRDNFESDPWPTKDTAPYVTFSQKL